jgi:PAS domain S-box-containing protein
MIWPKRKARPAPAISQALPLSTLFEHTGIGFAIEDLDAGLVEANAAMYRILGYGEGELLGKTILELTHPEDRERQKRVRQKLLRGDTRSMQMEKRYLRKNGGTVWAHVTTMPYCDATGRPRFVIGLVLDITRRKRTEEALRHSQEAMRFLLEQTPVLLWRVDSELRLTSAIGAGRAWADPRPPLVGAVSQTLYEHFETFDAQHPVIAAHLRALAGETVSYEFQSDTGKVYLCRVEPLRDESGRAIGAIGAGLDITEKHAAQEAAQVRGRHASTLATLGQLALGGASLEHLFQEASRLLADVLGVEYAGVYEADAAGGMRRVAGAGWLPSDDGPEAVPFHILYTLAVTHPVILEDAGREGRFETKRLRELGIVSGFAVLLQGEARPQGALAVYSRRRRLFSHDELHLLEAVANMLALALERHLAGESRARLLEQLITVQEEERRKIARELHDEAGQSLTALLLGLRAVEEAVDLQSAQQHASRLRAVASAAATELNWLAHGLHPAVLETLGLPSALNQHAREFAAACRLQVECDVAGLEGAPLAPEAQISAYRIVQEALSNAARHAQATRVTIHGSCAGDTVTIHVTDDGCGFDTRLRRGLGTFSMTERAKLLGGTVALHSRPGHGTVVTLHLPVLSQEGWTENAS